MKSLRALLAIGFVAALFAAAPAANAAQIGMCAPDVSGAATGARRVVNPVTNNAYSLNPVGCTLIGSADVGYFLSQGFTQSSLGGTIIYTTGALPASGTTDIPIPTALPAGAYIKAIIIQNTSANAVTGGVSIGSTANGTDVVAATASAATSVANSTLVKTAFSTTAATVLHAAPVTSSNTANLTFSIVYDYF